MNVLPKKSAQAHKKTKGALSMFSKAIDALKASNEMAKAVIQTNKNKIDVLKEESSAMVTLVTDNAVAIQNIEVLMGVKKTVDATEDPISE